MTAGVFFKLHGFNADHHLISNFFHAFGPSIDNFIVFFALSDQAFIILLLIFFDQFVSVANQLHFGLRDNHVILAKRNTGGAGMTEAKLHDLVAEYDRVFLAAMTVNRVNHLRDVFLGHLLVDNFKRNICIFRQQFAQNHTARSSVVNFGNQLAMLVHSLEAAFDFGMQGHDFIKQRMVQFAHVCKNHALARLFLAHDGEIIEAKNHIL